jgi:Holliday junction DNA helicase RuvA
MISLLRGKVHEHIGAETVLLCGGVGYGVKTLLDEQASLRVGEEAALVIYEHIREDTHDLYGFTTKSRKELFEKLLSVSGVGPKAALAIINLASETQVRSSIAAGDTKFIASAAGVGKKVAERVVVDLKNKVGIAASEDATAFLHGAAVNEADEALQALVGLGYMREDAANALAKIDASLPVEERVKRALRG